MKTEFRIQTQKAMPLSPLTVESGIFPLVQSLSMIGGLRSYSSCEGHLTPDSLVGLSHPYVSFESPVCVVVSLRKILKETALLLPWHLRTLNRPIFGLAYTLELSSDFWNQKTHSFVKMPGLNYFINSRFEKIKLSFKKDVELLCAQIEKVSENQSKAGFEQPFLVKNITNPSIVFCVESVALLSHSKMWRAFCDMLNIDPLTLLIEYKDKDKSHKMVVLSGIDDKNTQIAKQWIVDSFTPFKAEFLS